MEKVQKKFNVEFMLQWSPDVAYTEKWVFVQLTSGIRNIYKCKLIIMPTLKKVVL